MFLKARNNPGVARVVLRSIERRGPQLTRDLLRGLAVPALARDPERDIMEQAGGESFADTTSALREASILDVGDELRMTSDFAQHLGKTRVDLGFEPGDDDGLAAALCSWLLQEPQSGPDPCGPGDPGRGPTWDLAHTLSWYLDIEPSGAWPRPADAESSPVVRLQGDTGRTLPDDTFSSTTDWALFRRWAVFLGLAEDRPEGALDPDPTRAISWFLPVLVADDRVSALEFRDRLARVLPVIGGHIERSWHEASGVEEPHDIRPSVAHALARLSDDSEAGLQLDPGRDARDTLLLTYGTWEPSEYPWGTIGPSSERVAAIVRTEVSV